MSNRKSFRNGMGFAQIMATLLVVFPTLAFIFTILFDYWAVMQADQKLKLVANLTTEFAMTRDDLRDFSNGSGGNAVDYQNYLDRVSQLCPNQTGAEFTSIEDAARSGEIAVIAQYDYNGTYFKNQTISTRMNVYSYKDQNLSVVVTCQ
ncbi:hypothetical protein [Sulfurimonas microaerophilic]|uniref:hypothetical protein n=1 Tax=Sulfurimonas microaerophilic TaxID=3058392 RepID=UPI0027145D11|nr:hypothetical protein [Sulfurimonas sp. hsl 1-7]